MSDTPPCLSLFLASPPGCEDGPEAPEGASSTGQPQKKKKIQKAPVSKLGIRKVN